MNVYDATHALAKELSNSEEYRSFLQCKKALDTDVTAKKMVKDFVAKKMEIEYAVLGGKQEDKAATEQLQKMYDLLAYNPRARDFLQAYGRLQIILGDVYKILGDAVAEGMDFFAKD
jgi:cell fate (sporulation/competence/biofilm development) regulator YlbF (YheA/YmcA/DUF963 family)